MARIAAVFFVGLTAAFHASAAVEAAEPVDATDLWQAADGQPGWGVNVSQQGDTMFVTVLVHGKNSQPTWFVAPSTKLDAVRGGAGTFSGPLYSTGGSPYQKEWDRGDFSYRQVGTVSFRMTSPTTATISYSADGAQVTKELARQTVALNNLNGQYIGGVAGTFTGCANPESNGFTTEYASIAIVQASRNITMTLENWRGAGSCAYTGVYSQVGRIGSMRGNYTCSGGNSGTFTASEIERTTTGITMKVQEVSPSCRYAGRVGGVKATP
jgi:hypothetical protein